MTINYLKRKAKEYEEQLRSREESKTWQSLCDIQKSVVKNFIQYLEEQK
jgi:hypothetical protein